MRPLQLDFTFRALAGRGLRLRRRKLTIDVEAAAERLSLETVFHRPLAIIDGAGQALRGNTLDAQLWSLETQLAVELAVRVRRREHALDRAARAALQTDRCPRQRLR